MGTRSLTARDRDAVWHPYTQSGMFPDAIGITHGKGTLLFDENGQSYIDAVASWWVNLHGHAHPYMHEKISEQSAKLEQVIFAGFTHEPAVSLAERLLQLQPHFGKVFYSDNGSTAVEVAIKIALQYWQHRGEKRKKIIAIENAYHGDTFGAMAVSQRSMFTEPFWEHLFEVHHLPFPAQGREQTTFDALDALMAQNDVAAFIAEPCILGSGGMFFYSEECLETLFARCRAKGVLVIADEVMTGFGRTGTMFCTDRIHTKPDMMCLSKGLTGGYLPMGVTLCTKEIHQHFVSSEFSKMLFHGHSFTANPLACAAANASLDLLLTEKSSAAIQRISAAQKDFVKTLAHYSCIEQPRSMGVVMAMDLIVSDAGYASNIRKEVFSFFFARGILLRPMGNVLYMLPPYSITDEELNIVYAAIRQFLDQLEETQRHGK